MVNDVLVDRFDLLALMDGCFCVFWVVCVVLGFIFAFVRRSGLALPRGKANAAARVDVPQTFTTELACPVVGLRCFRFRFGHKRDGSGYIASVLNHSHEGQNQFTQNQRGNAIRSTGSGQGRTHQNQSSGCPTVRVLLAHLGPARLGVLL